MNIAFHIPTWILWGLGVVAVLFVGVLLGVLTMWHALTRVLYGANI
jgi:hypothetical protein